MKCLLDTCAVSELVSAKPKQRVVDWIDGVAPETVFLSVITIGEIRKGIEKLPDSKRKSMLHEWLVGELFARFSDRILPIDLDVILAWGRMAGQLELSGKKMAAMDSLIAAIALSRNLRLVTRNEDDFKHAGIEIVNPWKD